MFPTLFVPYSYNIISLGKGRAQGQKGKEQMRVGI